MKFYYLSKRKLLFLFFLLFSVFSLFGQKNTQKRILQDSIYKKILHYKSQFSFQKASHYFLKKNWDSTMVYALKQIDLQTNLVLSDYCHYYRAQSFLAKKVSNEAENELKQISKEFDFYYSSQMILGEIALELHQFKKALDYFKVIKSLPKSDHFYLEKNSIDHNMGICYLHLEQFEAAKLYLLRSNTVYVKEKDTFKLISSYSDLGNLYYEQYKDNLAIQYFEKAYKLSKLSDRFSSKRTTAFNMAIVEENRKDFAKALAYRKEYEQWNDSLNNQTNIWKTVQREKQDAIKEKEKEVVILEAENETKIAERNGFLYSSVILLILLGTGVYFYREKVKANKTIAKQKEVLNALNATKDYLFSVVSHDLRSPMSALRKLHRKLKDQIVKNDIENLEKTIETSSNISESMYGLLNNVLHWSLEQSKQLLFQPEINALQPIIEQVLFDFKGLATAKHISLETNFVNAILGVYDRESLKVILRNLLDNAIKYTPENGKIQIHTSSDENDCFIEIIDTGIGFSSAQLNRIHNLKKITIANIDRSKGIGLGLLLCVTLVKKNEGSFTIINNVDKGATIRITIPKT